MKYVPFPDVAVAMLARFRFAEFRRSTSYVLSVAALLSLGCDASSPGVLRSGDADRAASRQARMHANDTADAVAIEHARLVGMREEMRAELAQVEMELAGKATGDDVREAVRRSSQVVAIRERIAELDASVRQLESRLKQLGRSFEVMDTPSEPPTVPEAPEYRKYLDKIAPGLDGEVRATQ